MKYLKIVEYILMAVSVVVILLGVTSENVDLMLRWSYIVLGLAVALVILLPLYNLAQNPKGAIRSLVGLVAILILVGVAYALGSDATVVTPSEIYDNPVDLKVTDAGLYTTYVALIVVVATIIYGEIRNVFK